MLVEAKNADVKLGLGQCVAEMLAAQRFNKEKENNIHCVYGVTTSGTDWLFLKLEGQKLHIDMGVYAIGQCDKILGIPFKHGIPKSVKRSGHTWKSVPGVKCRNGMK